MKKNTAIIACNHVPPACDRVSLACNHVSCGCRKSLIRFKTTSQSRVARHEKVMKSLEAENVRILRKPWQGPQGEQFLVKEIYSNLL